jgi:hypothetical protein
MTPLVIRMTIVSDATTCSVTYINHSDDCNIFIIHSTDSKCESRFTWAYLGIAEANGANLKVRTT